MCGIFGYIGKSDKSPQIVLKGLKLLEYRGYDSWGVAVVSDKQRISVDKHVGKIGNAKVKLPEGKTSIGHTRWATHGGVIDVNAHPHLDCKGKIAVVHNGIVENFDELKKELIKRHHKFISETDTEVIPHLIEENLKSAKSFKEAVRISFNKLHGLNAIVVLNANENEIVACKTGSPLVIGKNGDGVFLASDASGIVPYTDKLLFVQDGEMVVLNKGIELLSIDKGKKLSPKFETVMFGKRDISKGRFKHFMLKEIYEQPKILRNIALNYSKEIEALSEMIKKSKGVFFIGSGTAYHACLLSSYLFSKIAKMHVNTIPASEFNYLEDFLTKQSLIIALSQSGETIDVIEPITRAKKKGSKIVAVTNTLGSTLYRMADYKILLGAGYETAVASTKAYTAKLAIIHSAIYRLAGKKQEGQKMLMDCVLEIERLLSPASVTGIKKLALKLKDNNDLYAIGRGASFATALEASLKIKEVSYAHMEGLAGGELKHGVIALIEKGTPCIVFAPKDETYNAIISNAIEIKSRGGFIIGIGPEKEDVYDYFIKVKDLGSASPIAQIVPIQLLSYFLALAKGIKDPDKPRNLAKSVTVK